MGRKSQIVISESLNELKNLLSKQKTLTGEKRIKCLIYIKEKKFRTRLELSSYLGIHIRTMERWLKTYTEEGVKIMMTNKPKPKPSMFITPEIHKVLEMKTNDPANPFLGYWDVQAWIKQEFGIDVNYHTVRKYLIKHFNTKIKSPRKSHIKKDPQAKEAFLKTARGIQTD